MKTKKPDVASPWVLIAFIVISCGLNALGSLHYVNLQSTNSAAPFDNWSNAATNIQDAIDAANAGDQVLVSNGIYATGGRFVVGAISNRVAVTKPIILSSVNGPSVTLIQGYQIPVQTNGSSAVRCVYLASGAMLSGFTLTNGATAEYSLSVPQQSYGGGAFGESNTIMSNCVFIGNAAYQGGGAAGDMFVRCKFINNSASPQNNGAGGGVTTTNTVDNCLFTGNQAYTGGASYGGILRSCTIVSNVAVRGSGGGTYSSTMLQNCIAYYNTATSDANVSTGTRLLYCCTVPVPITSNIGSFTNEPAFIDMANGNYQLQSNSSCINSGTNGVNSSNLDLDGNPRITAENIDVGAYENQTPSTMLPVSWLLKYNLATDGTSDFSDADGDGLNNWQEWILGTIPTNATSKLRLSSIIRSSSSGNIGLTWQSVTGIKYFVERSTNLSLPSSFVVIGTNIAGFPGTSSFFSDSHATGSDQFFYRVGATH